MKFWPHWLRSPHKKPVTSDRVLLIAKSAQELLFPHQHLLQQIRSQVSVPEPHWKKLYQSFIESFAGIFFVLFGFAGMWMGGTFLENFLPVGNLNDLFSGGVIPIIYILVGFKVAAELTGLIYTVLHEKES